MSNFSTVWVCQGPPRCALEGDDAVAAQQGGCVWCKQVRIDDMGREAVIGPSDDQPKGMNMRPAHREDGWPTRDDMSFWTPAEHAIWAAMQAVEAAGASPALTDAVILLRMARGRVADHVEGK